MYERRRNLVVRPDGRPVNVARPRGQLFVCASGCCCGRTEDGFAAVPAETFHQEWERRRLRNIVHLTIGGCLGPCALANVAMLLFDGQAQWFHSINSEALAVAIYDHIDAMLDAAPACRRLRWRRIISPGRPGSRVPTGSPSTTIVLAAA
jgi:cobaltochelatase CobN